MAMLKFITRRDSERITPETKSKLVDYCERVRSVAQRMDGLRREYLALEPEGVPATVWEDFIETNPALQSNAEIGPEPGPIRRVTDGMELLAISLREDADAIGEYLRSKGRADIGVDFIVRWILRRDDFHSWELLAPLLGKDEDYAHQLRRNAAKIRKVLDSKSKRW
jgi:hypothetical protein